MANRQQSISLNRHTRSDFTALRAYVQRVPAAAIARLYFTEDEDGNEATPGWVESYLRRMQASRVSLAIEHGSPVLAGHLKASARAHGSAWLTAVSLKMVKQAAALVVALPSPDHGVGMWFRPLVALRLKDAGIENLGQLIEFCNAPRWELMASRTPRRPRSGAPYRYVASHARANARYRRERRRRSPPTARS